MTKKILLIMTIALCIGVLSCCSSRLAFFNNGEKAFRDTLDAVFEALDRGDREGLKAFFAHAVIEGNSDFDSQVDAFFEVYQGPIEIEHIHLLFAGSGKTEYGKRQVVLSAGGEDVIIVADGVRYYVSMLMYTRDDFNKDNEGIHILEFATEDAYNSKYYTSHTRWNSEPGFYYQDSTEKRDDIMWIEGAPWRYTYFDRSLTADDLRTVVEGNDDFNHFIVVIGEPNCSWTTYAYYYYELENGLFAVCKVEDAINDVRPRVDGRVVRPNVIVAIYIADEEKNLETIWMADDIAKVSGSYHYFLPIDRELSEVFFKSFVSRSSSLSELKDEIGLPNIDKPMSWQCFYKISDDRFVECEFRGDHIEAFFVVDSEDRLYTIWKAKESTNAVV